MINFHRGELGRWLVAVVGVMLAYFLTGRLGLELAIPPGYATAIWPPSGIALAAVLLAGPRIWPGIFLGALMVNVVVYGDVDLTNPTTLIMPFFVASGAAGQAVLGGFLVRRLGGYPNSLSEAREIAQLLLYGGVVACLLSATMASSSLWAAGAIPVDVLPRHWSTWWAGDVIGVFVFTPLALILRDAVERRGRRRASIAIFWIGCSFMATVLVVSFATGVERDRQAERFRQSAQTMASSLAESIKDHVAAIQTVEGFYAGREQRDYMEFAQFSRRVRAQVSALQAVEWLPKVRGEDRAGFEKWVGQQGIAGFHITEKEDGRLVSAQNRAVYYPVTFVEPMTGNIASLGHDLNSDDELKDLLERSANSGEATFSGVQRLVQGNDGILIVAPLFEQGEIVAQSEEERQARLRGYVVGVIRLRALPHAAFDGMAMAGIDYWLIDETNHGMDILSSNSAGAPAMFELAERGLFGRRISIGQTFPIEAGGRQWRLQVAPNAQFLAQEQLTINWVVLFGGLLMTGVVGMFVLVATGSEQALRHQIAIHTAQFRRQNDSLRLLNNIAALRGTGLDGQLAEALDLARRHLQLDQAQLSRIEGGVYTVLHHLAGDVPTGLEGGRQVLSSTNCAVMLAHGDALAISNLGNSRYADHPSYRAQGVEAYIGAPVLVHGGLYGSVCFTSVHPYGREFDDGDLEFIRLLARWLGAAIERDEAQNALMFTHRRMAAILDNTPVGIAIVGFERLVMQANPTFCHIFGRRADEVVGKSARLLYPSVETYNEIGNRGLPILAAGGTFDEDVPMSRRDGQIIIVRLIARAVDSTDQLQGIVWAAEDVTERRAAEQALRERQEFFEQVFVGGAAVKLLIDPENGRIVDANPAAAVFYGYPLEQLRGMAMWDLDGLPPDNCLKWLRSVERRENNLFTYRHRLASGLRRDVEIYSGPIRVKNRALLMSIVHDVTDRVTSERHLAAALGEKESQAQELARSNAELEQFAYVASHDLRQPLRQVASYVGLLERMYGDKLDAEGREFIGFARSGAERMDRLIVDLLEYSRIGRKARALEPVLVPEVLTDICQILSQSVADVGGAVTLECDDDLGRVMGDRIELERLVQNLVGNALKYRSPDRPPLVKVAARAIEDGYVEVTVADNGIGIASEHFDRIFGIFQRLHGREEYEGTGIGLAVCKKIVDHHKGRIWLESKLGEGTTFHVVLPLAELS